MARPLRLEFEGALYHATARGDRRQPIYCDSVDREAWLSLLGTTCKRYNFVIHAYCQMTNHYHLMVETIDGGLHSGMRHLNSTYAQHFNRRHGVVGHLFQGRYKAILCQKQNYLLELARYIVLNPVRAAMVDNPAEWPWSSYLHVVRTEMKPAWLDTDWTLSQFGTDRQRAVALYREFVEAGRNSLSPLRSVSHQFLLGDSGFLAGYFQAEAKQSLAEVPRVQRKIASLPLSAYFERCTSRNDAIIQAYRSTAYSMGEIARFLGISTRTVSRAIHRTEGTNGLLKSKSMTERE